MIEIQNHKLQRVINALLLHSSFSENLGLFNGKMGISIAFFHLFRQTGNELYENYAGSYTCACVCAVTNDNTNASNDKASNS
jgi:hypothetical protein